MLSYLKKLFSSDFMPHGHCYLWTPEILWSHAISDSVIALSYFSIPFALIFFVRKRQDMQFRWTFVLFAVFITSCGIGHIVDVWNLWHGAYWLSSLVRILTAIASLATAIVLWPLIPKALAIPTIADLEKAKSESEKLVALRTKELEEAKNVAELYAAEMKLIFDHVPSRIFFKDDKNTILKLNRAAANAMGGNVEDFEGKDTYKLFPTIAKKYHDDDLSVINSGKPRLGIIEMYVPKDGVKSWVKTDKIPTMFNGKPGVLAVATDITELLEQQAQLRLTQFSVDNAGDSILYVNKNGQIEYANKRASEITGYSTSELLRSNIFLLDENINESDWSAQWKNLSDETFALMESIHKRKDGSYYDCAIQASYVDFEGTEVIVLFIRDTTASKREAELRAALFTQSTHPHFIFNHEGILDCNSAAVEILGFSSRKSLLKCHPAEFSPEVQPDGRRSEEKCIEMDRTAYEKGFHRFEWMHKTKQDEMLPVEVSLRPIKTEHGDSLLVVWQDLREIKATESVLKESLDSKKKQVLLLEKLTALKENETFDIDRQIENVLEFTCEYLGLDDASIKVGTPKSFTVQHCYSKEGITNLDVQPSLSDEVLERVYQNDRPVFFDAHSISEENKSRLSFYIGVPFSVNGKKFGIVDFSSIEPKKLCATEEEEAVILHISRWIAGLYERKSYNLEISETRDRLQLVLDNTPALIAYFDDDKKYQFANAKYLNWFNLTLEDIKDKHVSSVMGDTAYHEVEPYMRGALKDEIQRFEAQIPTREGKLRWIAATYLPVKNRLKRVIGFYVFAVDVDDQKRFTEELNRSNDELEQFAYIAAHDLKAPLRAIENYANWILEDSYDHLVESSQDHLRKIDERVKKMRTLLDDLLEYSRVGKAESKIEPIDLNVLVQDIRSFITSEDSVSIEIVESLPTIRTSRSALSLVLRNLISNSVKYHDKPSGWVRISSRIVGAYVEISVSDNGPGIERQYHSKVFNLFETLPTKDGKTGSGMGLALVKKAVEQRGGWIKLDDTNGPGATFRFLWPVDDSSRTEKRKLLEYHI